MKNKTGIIRHKALGDIILLSILGSPVAPVNEFGREALSWS
ncbi:hypothetical protein TRIP_E230047 [uncultured Spirochaetota bacterium]|jgi:hypothetical protein|uniref:Uncharacterized protein n=1 Tax=uncultured Spirochaetota bacterium TaxID=460511 RepID=A0A652ZVQ4_9SPIR|nr:hypothetical protein TRIP_E230047 [uncultured Spirochaetota bacterium]